MLQFYFLSVLLNIIAGLILVYAADVSKQTLPQTEGSPDSASSEKEAESENSGEESVQAEEETAAVESVEGESADSSAGSSEASEKSSKKKDLNFLSKNPIFSDVTFRLIIAILTFITGLMMLLTPIQDDVRVVGDLIPAIAGLAGGFALLLEYYSGKSAQAASLPKVLVNIFVGGKRYLGVVCILAGILHFIFPKVLFL